MLNYLSQFSDAIHSTGMEPPVEIHADGALHRFSPSGKRSDMAGWYVLHCDGIPAGSFGNWRTGHAQSWRADIGRSLSQAEINAHHAKIEQMRIERQEATAKLKEAAEWRATRMWSGLAPADPDINTYGARASSHSQHARWLRPWCWQCGMWMATLRACNLSTRMAPSA
ncbi:MAG: hypothetical protein ACYCY1_11455 [Sulfuriferula sp.]